MGNAIRWTEDQLAEYRKRGTVRTHRCEDEPDKEDAQRKRTKKETLAPHLRPHLRSLLEVRLEQQLNGTGVWPAKEDEPVGYFTQFYPIKGRDFTLDFAWPAFHIAIEVQGSPHRIKGKFSRDIEKRALLMLAGWRVLEVDRATIRDGRALAWAKSLLWEKMP